MFLWKCQGQRIDINRAWPVWTQGKAAPEDSSSAATRTESGGSTVKHTNTRDCSHPRPPKRRQHSVQEPRGSLCSQKASRVFRYSNHSPTAKYRHCEISFHLVTCLSIPLTVSFVQQKLLILMSSFTCLFLSFYAYMVLGVASYKLLYNTGNKDFLYFFVTVF